MAASVNLGTVHLSLELRLQKLRQNIADGKRELKGFEASLTQLSSNMDRLGKKMSLAITAPILLLGREAVNTAAKLDSLNMGIKAVDGEATDLAKTLKKLDDIAKLPGLGLVQAREGYVNLRAAGINADFATRSLKAFGNALATVGKGKAELDGVNYALVQLANRTSGFGQEIRQLQNFLPQIREAMKSAFGTTDSEAISKSGITGMQFVEGIVRQFEKLPQVTGGARNALENFDDLLIKLKDSIGKALLPNLIKWMGDLTPKIEAAASWFNKLDPAAKNTFANMAVALAVGGPLMVGLAALITSLTTVNAALLTMARNPLIAALLAAGATTAYLSSGGSNWMDTGMNRMMDNLRLSLGIKGPKTPNPTVGPFAPRPKLGNALGEVMRPGAGGGYTLGDFIPFAKGGGNRPRAIVPPGVTPPVIPDSGAADRARRIGELNRQAQYDLADPVKQAYMDMQKNKGEGMSRENYRALFRKDINRILKDLDDEARTQAVELGKKDGGVLAQIMLGDGSLSPQFVTTLRKTIQDLRTKLAPVLDLGIEEMWETRMKRSTVGGAEPLGIVKMIEAMEGSLGGALGTATGAAKPRTIGGMSGGDVGNQLAQAAKDAKRESDRFTYPLGQELGQNLAYEMGRSFGDAFDKVLGTGNPISRALSRTFSRLLDDLLSMLAQRAIGNKLMLSILGGSGGLAGTGAGLGGAGAAAAGVGGNAGVAAVWGGLGKKAGVSFGSAFAIAAGAYIVGSLIGNAFKSSNTPQQRKNIGMALHPILSNPSFAMGGGGMATSPTINFYGSNFNNDMDPRRAAESIAWHTQANMRSRPGS